MGMRVLSGRPWGSTRNNTCVSLDEIAAENNQLTLSSNPCCQQTPRIPKQKNGRMQTEAPSCGHRFTHEHEHKASGDAFPLGQCLPASKCKLKI